MEWNEKLTLCFAIVAMALVSGCRTAQTVDPGVREIRELATTLGLEVEGKPTEGRAKNFVGVRSEDLLVSRRTDSLTYFVQDDRWGPRRSGGVFAGTDEALLDRCRVVAATLGVDRDEILEASVVQVMSAVAVRDPATGEVRAEAPEKAERYARLTRAVEGIPVFSSGVTLALDRDGRLGFLELHWPELSAETVAEARKLRALAAEGWKPPELPGARVEAVDAGILHSPAIGFVMDVQPVLRVIYRPIDPEVGKKPVRYLDAEGRAVSIPRQFERLEVPDEPERQQTEPGYGRAG